MSGQVAVDETFIGGKERNKHPHRKLNAGRGPVGKAVVVEPKNRETKKVSAMVVQSTDQENLQGFIRYRVRVKAQPSTATITAVTDGLQLDFEPYKRLNTRLVSTSTIKRIQMV